MAVSVSFNWDNDGMLIIHNAETLKLYEELKYSNNSHPSGEKLGFFFAFGNKQFEEGKQMLIRKGHLTEGEKIYSFGAGCFGTKKGLDRMCAFYEDKDKAIRENCNPQEVYYYEYNNYECCIDFGGDERAIENIIDVYGADVARTIRRCRPFSSIDEILEARANRRANRK